MVFTGEILSMMLLISGMLMGSVRLVNEVDTKLAVIHHTASGDVSAATIDEWHKKNGWKGIGYHFVIREDGTIERGRSVLRKGAHAGENKWHKSRNHYVGIVLTGYDKFTGPQIESLKKIIKKQGILRIENHHKLCPGPGLDLQKIADEMDVSFVKIK